MESRASDLLSKVMMSKLCTCWRFSIIARFVQGQKELYERHGIVGWGHYDWLKSKLRECPHSKTLLARYAAVLDTEFGAKMPAVKWFSVLENCIVHKEGRLKYLLAKKNFEFTVTKAKQNLTPLLR